MSQPLEPPTKPLEIDPISFDVRLTSLKTPVVIEYDSGEVVVAQVLGKTPKRVQVRIAGNDKRSREQRHRPDLNIGELALAARKARPVRAFSLPKGRLTAPPQSRIGSLSGSVAIWSFVITLILAVITFTVFDSPTLWWLTLASLGVLTISGVINSRSMDHDSRPVYRTGGQPYEIEQLLVTPKEIETPDHSADLVNAVKEEYGALLSDIIYRIEKPALFDVAVTTSRAFTTALLQWDNTAGGLSAKERSDLAARIRLAFDAARQHAEKVGLTHIPAEDRDQVTRAAKALRLADDATTEGEALAARRRAVSILQSLTLYYLPDPEEAQAMIEGKPVLALPGRRREDDE